MYQEKKRHRKVHIGSQWTWLDKVDIFLQRNCAEKLKRKIVWLQEVNDGSYSYRLDTIGRGWLGCISLSSSGSYWITVEHIGWGQFRAVVDCLIGPQLFIVDKTCSVGMYTNIGAHYTVWGSLIVWAILCEAASSCQAASSFEAASS